MRADKLQSESGISYPSFCRTGDNAAGSLLWILFSGAGGLFRREGTDEKEMMNLLYVTVKALMNQQLDNRLIRCIYELRTMVEQGLLPTAFSVHRLRKRDFGRRRLLLFAGYAWNSLHILCWEKRCKTYLAIRLICHALHSYSADGAALFFPCRTGSASELEQIIHLYTARNTDRKFKSLQILEVMK